MGPRGRFHAGVLRESVALVWRASPRAAVAVLSLEVLTAVLSIVQVLILKVLLDRVIKLQGHHGSIHDVIWPLSIMAATTAASTVTGSIQPRVQRVLGELVSRDVWSRVLDVTGNVDLETYDTPTFYNQLQRIEDHALEKPVTTTESLMQLANSGLSSLGLVAVLFSVHWSLVPMLVLAAPPTIIASRRVSRGEYRFAVDQSPRFRLRLYLAQLLTQRESAKEVRAYDTGPFLRERHDRTYTDFVTSLITHVRRTGAIAAIGAAASAVIGLGALAVLLSLVADHQVSIASAGTAVVSIRLLASRVQTTTGSTGTLYGNALFLADLRDFCSLTRPQPERSEAPAPAFASLRLDKVGFTYPGSTKPTLTDIDLALTTGSVVALVGENGSGKTTLAKVIAQLYAPTAGSILWNGRQVSRDQRVGLRDQIAVLFQDFLHYRLPARDNVTLGRPSLAAEEGRLEAAAAASGADEVLQVLPEGWDTILAAEFGGQDLSLGQWQRIALARAWFRGSDLVILDEPTASLDPRAEARLFADVRQLLAGRTVLLITHRLASVRSADEIVVLSQGRVVERGSHTDLMAADGHYAELFRLQAAGYADVE